MSQSLYQDKFCAVCGKRFSPGSPRQKYCSQECAKQNKKLYMREWRRKNRKIAKRTCPICGGEFSPPYGNEKYCSPECRKEGHRAAVRGWMRRKAKGASRKRACACSVCGKAFETQSAHGRKYCSLECARAARAARVKGSCLRCGARISNSRLVFCSYACFKANDREMHVLKRKEKRDERGQNIE